MFTRLPGRFLVALACEGQVRVMCAVMQGPADELRERHALEPTAARLAAEGLVAAVLLSAHIKGEERMTVEVRSEAPLFTFSADIDATGTCRARFSPTRTDLRQRFSGIIAATKSLGPKILYRGVADVKEERFEGALQRYMTDSIQVDARVRIDAATDKEGRVSFASGLLVERLPGMLPETFAELFDQPLSEDFRALMTNFAFGQLAGGRVEVLGSQDFVYRCSCSRARVISMLETLGRTEMETLRVEQGFAEVTCHYCNTRYEVSGAELDGLIAAAAPDAGEA